jgi:hypothetical protein
MWQHLADSKPRARKRHRCFICSGSIWPGTIYRKSSFSGEGTCYTIKEHVECARVAAKWCDAWDYPDGYQGEDVLEAMEQGLHDFILSRDSDHNIYAIGDLDRDERIVWSRFRQAQARYEIRRLLNA